MAGRRSKRVGIALRGLEGFEHVLALYAVLFGMTGCATLLPSSQVGTPTEVARNCVPLSKTFSDVALAPPVAPAINIKLSQRVQYFSEPALQTAETIGALSYLQELVAMQDEQDTSLITILLRRHQLQEQILLAILEIESTTAEIICERDRADQLADRIDEVDGARIKQLTIASIIVGGLAGIVTGAAGLALATSTIADASSVGGGALSAWLGVSALFTHSEVNLRHDRNILKEVWEDPAHSRIISPILWRYLHRNAEGEQSNPRAHLVNGWRQKGRRTRRMKRIDESCFLATADPIRLRNCGLEPLCLRRLKPRSVCSMRNWKF